MALFMHQLSDLTKLGVSTALLWALGHLYVDSFVGQTMRRIQRNWKQWMHEQVEICLGGNLSASKKTYRTIDKAFREFRRLLSLVRDYACDLLSQKYTLPSLNTVSTVFSII